LPQKAGPKIELRNSTPLTSTLSTESVTLIFSGPSERVTIANASGTLAVRWIGSRFYSR
jgi:hypothetical protein